MEKSEKTWRCPYCDGLNDWQDTVCQICGDGTREEAIKPKPEPPKAKVTEPAKTKPEPPKAKATEPVKPKPEPPKAKTSEPAKPKPEPPRPKPEAPKTSAPEPVKPKPEASKSKVPEKSGKTVWKVLVLLLILAAGFCGYQYMGVKKTAEQVNFTLLQTVPNDITNVEGKEWLQIHGYQTDDDGNIYDGEIKWKIKYPTDTDLMGMQIRYTITSNECKNLALLYRQLEKTLENNQATKICSMDEISVKECIKGLEKPRLSVWQDFLDDTMYDLWSDGQTLTLVREFNGDFYSSNVIDERSVYYDVSEWKDRVDFDHLLHISMENVEDDPQWKENFQEEYAPSYSYYSDNELEFNDYNYSVRVGNYYLASNKAEVLRYVRDNLEEKALSTAYKPHIECMVSGENLEIYEYYVKTGWSTVKILSTSTGGSVYVEIAPMETQMP